MRSAQVGPPKPSKPLCSVPRFLVCLGLLIVSCNFYFRSPNHGGAVMPVEVRLQTPPSAQREAKREARDAPPPPPPPPLATLDGSVEAALRLAVPAGRGVLLVLLDLPAVGVASTSFSS